MALGNICGNIKTCTSDPYSRWQTNFFYRKNANPLSVVTEYFPCKNPHPQPHTYNFNLYLQMKNSKHHTTPATLQEHCWSDFNIYIKSLIETHHELIIGMDAN